VIANAIAFALAFVAGMFFERYRDRRARERLDRALRDLEDELSDIIRAEKKARRSKP